MSSFVFEQVKTMSVTGQLNFDSPPNGTYVLALCDSTIVDDPSTYSGLTLWSEIIGNQIPLTGGYTAPVDLDGVNHITSEDLSGDNQKDTKVYADNVVWNISTISASCAVVMLKDTGDITQSKLICALDIRNSGNPIISNNGVYTITLNSGSGGFLIIK